MPLVEYHAEPVPDSCEVCRYLVEHPEYDRRLEHTLTLFAQVTMLTDLEDAGDPLRMTSMYVETIGFPGPQTRIDPRHWLLGLLEAPEIRLMLEERNRRDG